MNAVATPISPVFIGVILVICVVVIGVVCISMLLYHIRKNPRRNHGYAGNTIYFLINIYITPETSYYSLQVENIGFKIKKTI